MKHQLHILREVYQDALVFAEEQGYPSTLRGLCSIVAYELSRRLRRAGYRADFVIGKYRDMHHCWVMTKAEILDPTVQQFWAPCEPDKPDWGSMRSPLDSTDYAEELSGQKAVDQLDLEWKGTKDLENWRTALKKETRKRKLTDSL